MKLISVVTILLVSFGCSVSTQAKSLATDEAQIEALFASYMTKYNQFISTEKFDKNIELYHENVMLVSNGRGESVATAEKMDNQVQRFLASLKTQGVASVKWESINIKQLDTKLALVQNVAVRFDEDGDVFNRVGATYLVQNGDSGWRIAAFTVHKPEFNQ